MKIQHGFALALVAFLMVGCAREDVTASPASPSPNPESTAIPASPNLTSIAQEINLSGTFVAGEHPTQGMVRLITRAGESTIELGEDFATSELGPDLVVILHRSDNVIGSTQPPAYPIQAGDYVVIAPLQQFQGAQRYTIPADINLADYRSVGIWCRKFNAMFGAATLS